MALRTALSGFVMLVVAMGIGRFAFTPQVPLMMAEGQLTLTTAGLVAAMNYLGYLVGAWDAMRASRRVEGRLFAGIAGAVIVTLLSAWADNAWLHGLLRFVIGCMSGLVIGALLVGGGFLCAVQLSLLYGRELAPQHTRYMAGLLTTGYAIGQLVGPVTSALSTWLTQRLEPALGVAAIALFIGGALVWRSQHERLSQFQ
ncbi:MULTISPECIES: YbfB/YjiJ family MFS transporter [Enterobacterales]|uniref:YbfB/YjiJ family MFS transporter n=1 Tax=Enterobacterales TaxID=91347 RepID=UPI002ED7D7C5